MTIISFNFNPFSVEGGSETVEVKWWWKVDVEEQVRAGQGGWEKRRDGSVRNSRGYIFRKRKQFPMECDSGLVADSYTVALLSLSLSAFWLGDHTWPHLNPKLKLSFFLPASNLCTDKGTHLRSASVLPVAGARPFRVLGSLWFLCRHDLIWFETWKPWGFNYVRLDHTPSTHCFEFLRNKNFVQPFEEILQLGEFRD